jgi:hypothetical protein
MGQDNPVLGIGLYKIVDLPEGVRCFPRIVVAHRLIGVEEKRQIGLGTDGHNISQGINHFGCQSGVIDC